MTKWYIIYFWRYIKSGGAPGQVRQVEWFLKLTEHPRLLKLWRLWHKI